MKTIKWSSIPSATETNKGLMSPEMVLGYNGACKIIKALETDPGYLINTKIPAKMPANVIVRITQHFYTGFDPGLVLLQIYPNTPDSNRVTKIGGTHTDIKVIDNNGNIGIYVNPAYKKGYAALVEIYACETTGKFIASGMTVTISDMPANAIVLSSL